MEKLEPSLEHSDKDKPSSSDKAIKLIKQVHFRKWYSKVSIFINNFELKTIALFDSGADLNCIQEGLIPTKYYKKSKETLGTASGNLLHLKFEIPKAHLCQNKVRFKTSFVLVRGIIDEVILGLPFITLLYPFNVEYDEVTSVYLGEKVKFQFLAKPELRALKALQSSSVSKTISLIESKSKQVNFLKEEVNFKCIEQQLKDISLQEKIKRFEEKIKQEICSELPNAFWHRKHHSVSLPYIKEFSEKNIPTKARPIQMSQEIMEFCKNEITELLEKK